MERHLQLDYLTLGQASELLAGISDQLADGIVACDGTELRVTGPVTLSVDLDASHTSARVTIGLKCHRPDGTSRLLQEELARPGG